MENQIFWSAVAGGIVGGLLGSVTAIVSSYWGPRWLETWRRDQEEERLHGARKELLHQLLENDNFEWRKLSTLANATGTTEEECKRLLIEIGARGSTAGDGMWALRSRQPISDQ